MNGADAFSQAQALPSAALVDWVVERYHEAHREQLPALVAQARELDVRVAATMQSLAEVIELHMFKEEARLFPMMVQGGNTLIGQLIDAMQAEHRAHEALLVALRDALAQRDGRAPDAAVAALRASFEAFAAALAEHARIEDEVLFPRFARASRSA
ncbi:MAG: hemerythrin domain-containing protein [Burkholderiaceae bacterium]|jgi:regulator of cell morphogenesis and NO signaling|nr:hemerythrin domain-containing protein [Burkholderiaceae bacterium]